MGFVGLLYGAWDCLLLVWVIVFGSLCLCELPCCLLWYLCCNIVSALLFDLYIITGDACRCLVSGFPYFGFFLLCKLRVCF